MIIKAVFDSSILISAFLVTKGLSNKLFHYSQSGAFVLCLSNEILDETERVLLEYQRLRKRYRYSDQQVIQYLKNLQAVSHFIINPLPVNLIADDPNDNMIIACAIQSKANYIISRDEHLLSLKTCNRIELISPENFIQLLRQEQ